MVMLRLTCAICTMLGFADVATITASGGNGLQQRMVPCFAARDGRM